MEDKNGQLKPSESPTNGPNEFSTDEPNETPIDEPKDDIDRKINFWKKFAIILGLIAFLVTFL